MNRLTLATLGGGAALMVAACGGAAASTTTPSPSSGNAGRGAFARNAAAGQLVQISGSKLILSNSSGDTTVTYTTSTTITQTSTGSVADIASGTCITVAGQKDSTGHITASTVAVRDAVNGSCAGGGFGGFGGGFGGGGRRTPNPNVTPPPQAANFARVSGQVTSGGVNGTSVSVKEATGTVVTMTIPTTVRVRKSDAVSGSALSTGQCVSAFGSKSSSGTVAARVLTILPAGPNGCFSRGSGSGGGFGGGGFGAGGPAPGGVST